MRWHNYSNDPRVINPTTGEPRHAFLSPSGHSWIRYDDDTLITRYRNSKAREEGTELHELASRLIKKSIKLPKTKTTLNMYVNDAIGYRMQSEQTLFYSPFCFGTADAIRYDEKHKFLRIHDLKTGVEKASMEQLEIYAALFCLEYSVEFPELKDPANISIELRIYQNNDVIIEIPDVDKIRSIMSACIHESEVLDRITKGEIYA